MSLVKKETAAPNGTSQHATNGDARPSDQRVQLAQRNGSHNDGNDLSRDYNPPPASFSSPKHNGAVEKRGDGPADFFSSDVFQIVLHNPTTAHRLLKFSQARMCGENMEFLEKVHDDDIGQKHSADSLGIWIGGSLHRTLGRIGNHYDRHTSLLHGD